MAEFTPQLRIPAAGDPYYNTKSGGGFNPCALGNNSRGQRVKGLNVLPNCVGYVVGRFNAIGQYGTCKWLAARGNACDFIKIATAQGLQISDKPTLGGVMVWAGGKGGYGHVAVVERIQGAFVETSESEYYGAPFVVYKRSGPDYRAGCYWMGASYRYLGCIANPAVKEEKPVTYKEFCEFMDRWLADRAKEPADAWAEKAIERVTDAGIMGAGDNFRPRSLVTREELAQTFSNILPDR